MGLYPSDLVVLGSGSSLPTERRGPPGYLLRFADGSGVLLDAGPGSVREAARHGVGPGSLRGALMTHLHPDHTADLVALCFARRSPLLEGAFRLHLVGPRGLCPLFDRLQGVWGDWLRLPADRLTVREIEPGPLALDLDGIVIEGQALAMPHLAHSLGFRIHGAAGRILAYSGDTGWGDEPVELGSGADIYLLEAALPLGDGSDGHLTPALAGRVADRAGCAHLVITHLYPPTEQLDLEAEVRREFEGRFTVASDGMILEF